MMTSPDGTEPYNERHAVPIKVDQWDTFQSRQQGFCHEADVNRMSTMLDDMAAILAAHLGPDHIAQPDPRLDDVSAGGGCNAF